MDDHIEGNGKISIVEEMKLEMEKVDTHNIIVRHKVMHKGENKVVTRPIVTSHLVYADAVHIHRSTLIK